MKIKYVSSLPILLNPCTAFPGGRNFSKEDIGKEITVASGGKSLCKLPFFEEVKTTRIKEEKEEPKKMEDF